ncbi:Uridine-cytidine kinase 1-B [Bienertia sinuspersici]
MAKFNEVQKKRRAEISKKKEHCMEILTRRSLKGQLNFNLSRASANASSSRNGTEIKRML